MELNLSKTKIVIFNKRGRLLKENVYFGECLVECVKTYKYLGLDFSNSGSFQLAIDNIKTKARKACFKLKQSVDPKSLQPKVAMNIFNSMVRPITLYGAEVWGAYLCCENFEKTLAKLEKLSIENVYIGYAKYILGVHKNTTNAAIRGELGIYPVGFEAIRSSINYNERLTHLPSQSLLAEISNNNILQKTPWYIALNKFITSLGHHKASDSKTIISTCKDLFREKWKEQINSGGKLRTYAHFKNIFQYENYLNDVHNVSHRRALTKLRTSSHGLHIETGRYTRPKVAPENRICLLCNASVENEAHFILHCSIYDEERTWLFKEIDKSCVNFASLDNDDKFQFLMSAEGCIVRAVASFCFHAFEKRKSHSLSYRLRNIS